MPSDLIIILLVLFVPRVMVRARHWGEQIREEQAGPSILAHRLLSTAALEQYRLSQVPPTRKASSFSCLPTCQNAA